MRRWTRWALAAAVGGAWGLCIEQLISAHIRGAVIEQTAWRSTLLTALITATLGAVIVASLRPEMRRVEQAGPAHTPEVLDDRAPQCAVEPATLATLGRIERRLRRP